MNGRKGKSRLNPDNEFIISQHVDDLKDLNVDETLSLSWIQQQQNYLLLNKNAYISAISGLNENVKRLLKEESKGHILIRDTILTHLLKRKAMSNEVDSGLFMEWFVFVQKEVVLLNLLETLCFHSDFLYSLGERLIDLVDFCYRIVAGFFGKSKPNPSAKQDQFKSGDLSLMD